MRKTQITIGILLVTVLLIFGACAPTPTEPNLEERLAEALSGDVLKFQLQKIDVVELSKDLERGVAHLPLVNEKGEVVTLTLPAERIQLREPGLTTGYLRAGSRESPSIEEVTLPPEQNFRLGDYSQEKPERERASCGALTIMDEAQTMVSGMVIEPSVGVTFFEPVDLILGGRSNPGLHILYNIRDTVAVVFPDEEQPKQLEGFREALNRVTAMALTSAPTLKQTRVVLDGDVQFYNVDRATVWSRQEAAHNCLLLIYGLIEPLSSGTWGLYIPIKGQEVWVSGGPSTKDGDDLIDELVDPNYFLINQVDEDELHYFFVGYTVTGLYGKAAGIGSAAGGFGGGAGKNHAFGDGRSTSSLKTHWVVMAHELGHLLGGKHGDGVLADCAGGLFFSMCGPSLMPAGGAGAPDTREPYFSDANDTNIINVIAPLLSDW